MTVDLFGVEPSGAVLSDDGRYRYHLWRAWPSPGDEFRPMGFVMLNPSTADADADDATIRRCVGFARREGCNAINVVNLFAWRARDPRQLAVVPDPVGPDNHNKLECLLDVHTVIDAPLVVAWGAAGPKIATSREAIRLVDRARAREVTLWCLGTTAIGWPRHPLYLADRTPLEVFP